jgi:ABC-type polysaccharide/polyol phosphate transport system ATPase subunit
MDTVISFKNVSKKYRIGQSRYNSLREDISNSFGKIFNFNKCSEDKNFIWALKDVNFEVKKGESLGIIGPNGAGKTTILKLLSHITLPTEGSVTAKGRVSALIELGAGLHPELSGRENIYLYGSIMGMEKKVIEKKFDEIVDFSGLRQFIDTPVKRYSSGMYVRLGFAVAISSEPDILLVDEVLAVGDISFQKKCLDRINSLKRGGKTIIFISHNMTAIQGLCERAIFLNRGKIVLDAEPKDAIGAYLELSSLEQSEVGKDFKESAFRRGTLSAEITQIRILNRNNEESNTMKTGEKVTIQIKARFNEQTERPIFGFILYNSEGLYIYGTNTKWLNFEFPGVLVRDRQITVNFTQDLFLAPGLYYITPAIADYSGTVVYDSQEKAVSFKVVSDKMFEGLISLNTSVAYE